MEDLIPFPHSSNPSIQTLLINPTNHVNQTIQKKEAMKNFRELIFKLAETHPNKPLNPATKSLLQCRLNRFVSEYKTPDHPPYSSMIERTLEELNEKTGSSVESISQHLEKSYDNLPFAHSVLLKHHLEKLGETGEIVVTHDKKYGLPGRLKLTKRRGRRMHWKRKQKLRTNSQKREEDDEVKHDEKEQVTENGNKSNQTKLEMGPSGFKLINVESSRSTELEIVSAEKINESSTRVLRWQNRLHRRLPELKLTSLKSGHKIEISQDQQKTFDSSPIVMNLEESQQPKCRRLRVLLKPKPDSAAAEEGVKKVLLQCNSEQKPAKRRPGRPPKRAVAT